jgi:hypothetical protein
MLEQKVQKLINLKQEGSYWDFKRNWYSHDKKQDLLHDIICMANNLENKDAYIIIGVDEENDYKTINISDDNNRRNTQMIVDFLRDKEFAGGIRPTIHVESLFVDNNCIDVIVVKNGLDTPYYLTKKFQNVMANNIYTRVMDTNTPKNKSADIHHVEYLWKKRFRLITTPLERVKYYLMKPNNWLASPADYKTVKSYHKYFPEFTIEYTLDDNGDAYQYYLFNQTDKKPHWREIRILYHQTVLAEYEGVALDGGRYFTTTPETDGISLDDFRHWDIIFKYFQKDNLNYIIHQFYYEPNRDDERIAHDRFIECLLVFESEIEKEEFKQYAIRNWHKGKEFSKETEICLPFFPSLKGYNMEEFKKEYRNVQILKRLFEEFKATRPL